MEPLHKYTQIYTCIYVCTMQYSIVHVVYVLTPSMLSKVGPVVLISMMKQNQMMLEDT